MKTSAATTTKKGAALPLPIPTSPIPYRLSTIHLITLINGPCEKCEGSLQDSLSDRDIYLTKADVNTIEDNSKGDEIWTTTIDIQYEFVMYCTNCGGKIDERWRIVSACFSTDTQLFPGNRETGEIEDTSVAMKELREFSEKTTDMRLDSGNQLDFTLDLLPGKITISSSFLIINDSDVPATAC